MHRQAARSRTALRPPSFFDLARQVDRTESLAERREHAIDRVHAQGRLVVLEVGHQPRAGRDQFGELPLGQPRGTPSRPDERPDGFPIGNIVR